MLLVARVDMSDQGTLTRQKTARYLESFPMPKLTLSLHVGGLEAWMAESGRLLSIRNTAIVVVLVAAATQVRKKAKLGGDAEVGDGQVADLLENGVP